MALSCTGALLPIPQDTYERLFHTLVPGFRVPVISNPLELMAVGDYDFITFSKDVHKLNAAHPVDRRQMETS